MDVVGNWRLYLYSENVDIIFLSIKISLTSVLVREMYIICWSIFNRTNYCNDC